MGTDIHSHAEQRTSAGWVHLDDRIFVQDYRLFAWLAGVRQSDPSSPIAAGRGLPPDVCITTRSAYENDQGNAHSVSWVAVSELLSINYDQPSHQAPSTRSAETLRACLPSTYFAALERLRADRADRVVFWFDG